MMKKLSGKSLDISQDNIDKLKELFPNVINEDKVDIEKLRLILGDDIDERSEKYQFTWPGKADSIRLAQSPSTKTLRPSKKESKNWETTENLYIEGDNLDVLKQLQKTYHNKIDAIYIDPPYNTGNDFVYNDKYLTTIEEYKDMSNQRLISNPQTSGRYHSNWLNMIYPRLMLSRNLLARDGVIFVSIDHNEVNNLKSAMDEIFGENNNVGLISIINNMKGRSDDKYFATNNEFLLVYAKNANYLELQGHEIDEEEIDEEYSHRDEISYYKLIGLRKTGNNWERETRPYMFYPILYESEQRKFTTISNKEYKKIYNSHTDKFDDEFCEEITNEYSSNGYIVFWPLSVDGQKGRWRWGVNTFLERKDSELELNSAGNVCSKMRATLEDGSVRTKKYKSCWYEPHYETGGSNRRLMKLFNTKYKIFDNPKSEYLITDILSLLPKRDALILDFFSGSATTAQAAMELNSKDNGTRRFIMVQLPEVVDVKSDTFKAGFQNLCDVGKERIRLSGDLIFDKQKKELDLFNQKEINNFVDTGFKVFKLDETNLISWDSSKVSENEMITLLDQLEGVFKEDRSHLDVVYEIMLKYGVFDMPVEETNINNKIMYNIGQGYMLICLEENINNEDVVEIGNLGYLHVIFNDKSFKNDNVKLNAEHTLKNMGVEEVVSI